jgi:hypothetical protein
MSVTDNDTATDTTEPCQNADSSLNSKGSRLSYLKLAHTRVTSFHLAGQEVTVSDAPPEVFDAFIAQVVEEIVHVDRAAWEIFDRWHIINACLEADVLILMELLDGRLTLALPDEEEMRPTAPLTHHSEADAVAPADKEA